MGRLINGKWVSGDFSDRINKGHFERTASKFRNWINADGSAGSSGKAGFKAEAGRYHLYVSYACPWAHRTLIFRRLKQLEDLISVDVVSPDMLEDGWQFNEQFSDSLYGSNYLHQIYTLAAPSCNSHVSVPVLWDKKRKMIVNNESAEIIRMFNSAFNELTGNHDDYYPADLKGQIDAVSERVYAGVNNGVYRCGFATTQEAYEEAFDRLFSELDWLEDLLDGQLYLVGGRLTEADWRLFTTLIRFDAVYFGHFKCNKKRIVDYPNLAAYLKRLYNYPGIAETVHFDHIKRHYYYSHVSINPTRIVPKGPELELTRI